MGTGMCMYLLYIYLACNTPPQTHQYWVHAYLCPPLYHPCSPLVVVVQTTLSAVADLGPRSPLLHVVTMLHMLAGLASLQHVCQVIYFSSSTSVMSIPSSFRLWGWNVTGGSTLVSMSASIMLVPCATKRSFPSADICRVR